MVRCAVNMTIWLLALAAGLTAARPLPADPSPVTAREEEALDLVASIMTGIDPVQQKAAIHKLSLYRYPSVAFALVQMLEDYQESPLLVRETEWSIAAMAHYAVEPLTKALAERRIPRTSALMIVTRIARQDPGMVAPLVAAENLVVARTAGIAVASCGHPAALKTLLDAWDKLSPDVRPDMLQVVCNVSRSDCGKLLVDALASGPPAMRIAAAGLLVDFADPALAAHCIPLLHDDNPAVVRAALEALTAIRVLGIESDLAILFDAAPDDIKEQVLDLMGTLGTPAALDFLAAVRDRYAPDSPLGRKARTLLLPSQ